MRFFVAKMWRERCDTDVCRSDEEALRDTLMFVGPGSEALGHVRDVCVNGWTCVPEMCFRVAWR